jgi:outer membrane protein
MKFQGIYLSALTLVAGISFTLIGCGTSGNNKDSKNESLSNGEPIVYVNSDSLLDKYDYYKKVKKSLEDKSQSMQIDAEQKQKAFQNEVQAYQKNAFNLTPAQKKNEEARLGKENQQIQAFQQNLSQELAQESQDVNDKLNSRIRTYLEGFSKENHCKMVLGYSTKGGSLLYAQPGLEVTNKVIKGLNEAYAKEK